MGPASKGISEGSQLSGGRHLEEDPGDWAGAWMEMRQEAGPGLYVLDLVAISQLLLIIL